MLRHSITGVYSLDMPRIDPRVDAGIQWPVLNYARIPWLVPNTGENVSHSCHTLWCICL